MPSFLTCKLVLLALLVLAKRFDKVHAGTAPVPAPTQKPTPKPSPSPTIIAKPSPSPIIIAKPSPKPTGPSPKPTVFPTPKPTFSNPTPRPTRAPSPFPTIKPTFLDPTSQPTSHPSSEPTQRPSSQPTGSPTGEPTGTPSGSPSGSPTSLPSSKPTSGGTPKPSRKGYKPPPTIAPTMKNQTNVPVGKPEKASSASIGPGPIAGIVIAVVLVLVGCGFYCCRGKNNDGSIRLVDADDEAFANELASHGSLPALHTPHIDEQNSVFNPMARNPHLAPL